MCIHSMKRVVHPFFPLIAFGVELGIHTAAVQHFSRSVFRFVRAPLCCCVAVAILLMSLSALLNFCLPPPPVQSIEWH